MNQIVEINLTPWKSSKWRCSVLHSGKICLKSQRGQAIIELSLMMTFLFIILLAMVLIHEFGIKNIMAMDAMRHNMRASMRAHAGDPFTKNVVRQDVFVGIPGKMKQIFGTPFMKAHHEFEFYEGSYQGAGDSKYKRKYLYRKIELQN